MLDGLYRIAVEKDDADDDHSDEKSAGSASQRVGTDIGEGADTGNLSRAEAVEFLRLQPSLDGTRC